MGLLNCCLDGSLDVEQHMKFRKNRSEERHDELELLLRNCQRAVEEEMGSTGKQKSSRSYEKAAFPMKLGPNNELIPMEPRETIWWGMHVQSPPLNEKRFHKKFRRRFRMPHNSYLDLLQLLKESYSFVSWTTEDATGRSSSPLELMLLGTLRYLGRGFTFDDCEECAAMSEETHRRFFHVFIHFGSAILFAMCVVEPSNSDVDRHRYEFEEAGLPGCVGSMDAVGGNDGTFSMQMTLLFIDSATVEMLKSSNPSTEAVIIEADGVFFDLGLLFDVDTSGQMTHINVQCHC